MLVHGNKLLLGPQRRRIMVCLPPGFGHDSCLRAPFSPGHSLHQDSNSPNPVSSPLPLFHSPLTIPRSFLPSIYEYSTSTARHGIPCQQYKHAPPDPYYLLSPPPFLVLRDSSPNLKRQAYLPISPPSCAPHSQISAVEYESFVPSR